MQARFRTLIVLTCAIGALLALAASAQAAPPANDNIADAIALTPGIPVTVDATDADPELEPGELAPANPNFGKTVWFKWTAPSYGEFTFSSCGSVFDTVTSAYSDIYGNGLELYAPGARVDGGCPSGGDALPTLNVGPGEVIFFQVGAYNKNNAAGDVTATLQFDAPPANDNFANSSEISDGDALPGTNVAATSEFGEPSTPWAAERTVWYHFDAPSNGEVNFDTCDASFDSAVIAMKGSAVNELNPAGPNYYVDQGCPTGGGSKISDLRVRAGERIYFRVQSYPNTPQGTFTATLSFNAGPANDDFSAATALVGDQPAASFSTAYASLESGEPTEPFNTMDRSVWFTYAPTLDGYVTFDTCDAQADTVITVSTGNSLDSLNLVSSIDQGCPSGSGSRTNVLAVTAYTVYRIRVANFSSPVGDSGTLRVDYESVPPNDNWADARDLGSGSEVAITDDNRYATNEIDEPQIFGAVRPMSVWYKWTAPYDGVAIFGSCGVATGGHDGVLAVFTGSALNTLSKQSEADYGCSGGSNGMGRFSTDVTAGTVYWIAVANWSSLNGVNFGVEIGMIPVNTAAPTISGANSLVGTELTASPGSWSGASPITYAYQWRRCDADALNCADIAGAESATYTIAGGDIGGRVRVRVTATNSLDTATADSYVSDVVDLDTDSDGIGDNDDVCPNHAPDSGKPNGCPKETISVIQLPSISGDRQLGATLTGDAGDYSVPDLDPAVSTSVELQWMRCPAATGSGCSEIAGADAGQYTLTADDVGQYITLRVDRQNSDDSSTVYSDRTNEPAIVGDTDGDGVLDPDDACPSVSASGSGKANGCPTIPVSVTQQPTLGGTAQVGQTLTVNPGSAANDNSAGDPEITAPTRVITVWSRCDNPSDTDSCVMIGSASGNSYSPTTEDVGKTLYITVIWSNGEGQANGHAMSAVVTAAPVDPDPITPTTPDPLNLSALKFPKKASANKLVKAKGKFTIKSVQLPCPAGGAACKFSLSLTTKIKKKSKKLGSSTLTIPAGSTKPLSGKLSSAGLKQLKKSKKLKATITVKGSGGASGKATLKELNITK